MRRKGGGESEEKGRRRRMGGGERRGTIIGMRNQSLGPVQYKFEVQNHVLGIGECIT